MRPVLSSVWLANDEANIFFDTLLRISACTSLDLNLAPSSVEVFLHGVFSRFPNII